MTQHDLLTALDAWHNGHSDRYTAELLRQAAAEIRRLSPPTPKPKLTAEEYAEVVRNYGDNGL